MLGSGRTPSPSLGAAAVRPPAMYGMLRTEFVTRNGDSNPPALSLPPPLSAVSGIAVRSSLKVASQVNRTPRRSIRDPVNIKKHPIITSSP